MNGIKFNGQHSFADFGLILTHYAANSPQVKKQTVEIAGRDGVLDMTEYFGGVKYGNRQLDFTFVLPNVSAAEYSAKLSLLQDKLHGVQVRVEPDVEPLYYYEGRAEVSGELNRTTGSIKIVVDAKPYKYKISRTGQIVKLCGKNCINIDDAIVGASAAWTKTDTGFYFNRGVLSGGSYAYFTVPVAAGKTYTFSADITATGTDGYLYVYSDRIYGKVVTNGTKKAVFKAQQSGLYCFALITNSTTTTADFANVMLEEGSNVTNYEPFDGTETTATITVTNSKMPSIPDIFVQYATVISKYGYALAVGAKTKTYNPEFQLHEGSNEFALKGAGVVVFDWQEGGL